MWLGTQCKRLMYLYLYSNFPHENFHKAANTTKGSSSPYFKTHQSRMKMESPPLGATTLDNESTITNKWSGMH